MLQRRMSKKKKGSNQWRKACRQLAKLHNKIANQRLDFLHKQSTTIVGNYGTIAVEKLNLNGMLKNHCLAKHISDASWGTFTQMLAYKAESAGGRVIWRNPRGTSQTCSRCGFNVPKTLAERIHNCPHCGFKAHRDVNAAINILNGTPGRGETYKPVETTASTRASQGVPASGVEEAGTIRDRS